MGQDESFIEDTRRDAQQRRKNLEKVPPTTPGIPGVLYHDVYSYKTKYEGVAPNSISMQTVSK